MQRRCLESECERTHRTRLQITLTGSAKQKTRLRTLLPGEIYLHLRRLVFDRLAGDVDERLLNRAGERERSPVVRHHRRTCVAPDANAPSQPDRERYGHRQIAAPDRRTIDQQGDLCWHSLTLGYVRLAGRRELETEDVIALGN